MSRFDRTIRFLASGFYSGLFPIMPGTFASLIACSLFYALCVAVPVSSTLLGGILLTGLLATAAIIVSNAALERCLFGDGKDPRPIVLDEFAGCGAALAGLECSPGLYLAAFVLFRIFDVLKPPPVSALERLPRGWGVVLDDVAAGILANIIVRISLEFIS
jgi:phosphatidylglycerophosphatase A